jgi:glutamate synthase (NADPH/NADH) small chain
MADPKGFLKYTREGPTRRPPELRILDWKELYEPFSDDKLQLQGARCMDCGVPFCQSSHGCPVVNLIPEWNDLVHRGRWKDALKALQTTNNFPEFTGRLCPAP